MRTVQGYAAQGQGGDKQDIDTDSFLPYYANTDANIYRAGSVPMHTLIANKIDEITIVCKEFDLKQLILFGSGVRGHDFDPDSSDADFFIEFRHNDDSRWHSLLRRTRLLNEKLARILGRDVDLLYYTDNPEDPVTLAYLLSNSETIYSANVGHDDNLLGKQHPSNP